MALSRRDMMKLAGRVSALGVLAQITGCGGSSYQPYGRTTYRPGADWPDAVSRPTQHTPYAYQPPARSTSQSSGQTRPTPSPYAALAVMPRSAWTRSAPVGSRINSMTRINRLTLHHEGWTPVYFDDKRTTAQRLEKDRVTHVRDRGWGDLGYHFIVDRAGRVWEGRDVRFQGAHVKDHNEGNIGVMILGNFDKQTPSEQQLASVVRVCQTLGRQYRITPDRIHTHQELNPTACPGRYLQPRIASLRSSGYFA